MSAAMPPPDPVSLVMVTSKASVSGPDTVAALSPVCFTPVPVVEMIAPGKVTFTVIEPREAPPSRSVLPAALAWLLASLLRWKTIVSSFKAMVQGSSEAVKAVSVNEQV